MILFVGCVIYKHNEKLLSIVWEIQLKQGFTFNEIATLPSNLNESKFGFKYKSYNSGWTLVGNLSNFVSSAIILNSAEKS